MTTTWEGGCLCGQVRYVAEGEPRFAYFCHCRDCQRAHGSAFCPGMMFPIPSMRIVQGAVKNYEVRADNGLRITRQFCPDCGSPLFSLLDKYPGIIVVKAGTLDDPAAFRPQSDVWARSELPWAHIEDGLERLPEGRAASQQA